MLQFVIRSAIFIVVVLAAFNLAAYNLLINTVLEFDQFPLNHVPLGGKPAKNGVVEMVPGESLYCAVKVSNMSLLPIKIRNFQLYLDGMPYSEWHETGLSQAGQLGIYPLQSFQSRVLSDKSLQDLEPGRHKLRVVLNDHNLDSDATRELAKEWPFGSLEIRSPEVTVVVSERNTQTLRIR